MTSGLERSSRPCSRPFLVDIQNVDISSLDFRDCGANSENKSKSRHVTFVEATTFFILVGSTSGTVYFFSRESLDFLLMIPFKGGKVCHISASNAESEVGVASIRGRVSIYRMSPNLQLSNSQGLFNGQYSKSSIPADSLFRHLTDIPHHVNNEVTEMKWSSNGKFLFVGDNQGVISQTDVGSLEEFPRPPSRVILKLLSRILQIDCCFPYLAVSTLAATFLCDLEKEDFTRIQLKSKDIKSAGLCIICQDNKMCLVVGEVGTGSVFRCGMDGSVISCTKVDLSPPGVVCNAVGCFNPKNSECAITNNNARFSGDLNFSPGKMFTSNNDQFIISVSSNRIFIHDSKTCRIILWNEEFNRINSLKIIANYAFLWYANKLQVFALTPFLSYGKQLFKAGLNPVLENWISYALTSIGHHAEEDLKTHNNFVAIKTFREIMSPIDENDEFYEFVGNCTSFDLIDPEVKRKLLLEESYDKKLQRCAKHLANSVKMILGCNSSPSEKIQEIFEALQEFYFNICSSFSPSTLILEPVTKPDVTEVTLLTILRSTHIFLRQPQLLNLKQDLCTYSLESDILKKVVSPILNFVIHELSSNCALELSLQESWNFLRFSKCPLVQKYFTELGISSEMISYDALIADIIILLLPLVHDKILFNYLSDFIQSCQLSSMFFTWLSVMTFFNEPAHSLPFSGLLRTLQNPQYFEKLAEEIFSSVYREVIFPRSESQPGIQTVTCFTHFVTFTILYSKSPEISKSHSVANLLLSLFPLKRGLKQDLIQKILQLSSLNEFLFKMYYKACLEDGKSFNLCECGIQGGYGSLDKEIPPFQRAIEEAIFHKLVEQYFQNDGENSENRNGDLLKNTVHCFAMRRCLILQYFESTVADDLLPHDQTKIAMILRSGVCGALKHLKFSDDNLKTVLEALKQNGNEKSRSCLQCGMELTNSCTTNISTDCVGVWILESLGSMRKFMEILGRVGLNTPGDLSLRFYQLVIKRIELKTKRKEKEFSSNLTCSMLH